MRYVVAGGGTGGHLFPGIALADAFRDLDADAEIVFMGASGGLEVRIIPDLGYKLVTLPVRGVVNLGIMRGFTRALNMLWSIIRAYGILGKLSPDLVVGVGGYASVPAVVAAAIRKVPRCILEQNVVPGKASRFLARYAQRIYLGFPTLKPAFPPEKTMITGNPIREESLPPDQVREFADERKTLLILGGSQGAAQLNDLAMLIVPPLMARDSSLKVVHQTGLDHEASVREHYIANKVDVEVVPFIRHMGNITPERIFVSPVPGRWRCRNSRPLVCRPFLSPIHMLCQTIRGQTEDGSRSGAGRSPLSLKGRNRKPLQRRSSTFLPPPTFSGTCLKHVWQREPPTLLSGLRRKK